MRDEISAALGGSIMKCWLSEGQSQPSGDVGRWMAADGIQEIDRGQMGSREMLCDKGG